MLGGVDNVLNRFTMYRVLLYGLILLLASAGALGLAGKVSVSAGGLAVSAAALLAGCYVTNKVLGRVLRVPTNTESWLISALILACVLPPANSTAKVLYAALAGVLAMASKFIIIRHGRHILNPAAFGVFVVSITGLLPAAWWVATPWLTPFTAVLAFAVLRKQRRFQLFFIFAVAALAMLILTGSIVQGLSLPSVLHSAALSWPIIFFGSIMLTEPETLPPTRYYQLLLAVIIGLLFTSQLHAGRLATSPQTVLLAGNILTALAVPGYGFLLRLKSIRSLSPNIYEISFDRPPWLHFQAGQYAELTLPHKHVDSRGNRRTFSIASPSAAPEIRFAFRVSEKSSSFKRALINLPPGSLLRLGHVAGDFVLPADTSKPLLFIAGGIGITPYHSMIGSFAGRRDAVLLYLASNPQDFVYYPDFNQAAGFGVRAEYFQGRLTPDILQRLVPDLRGRVIYLSGPDAMVRSYKSMLSGIGVKRSSIRTDYFAGY